MKKLLLMMVALVATVSISAQENEGWNKSFAPVSDKAELAALHTAVAGDGSVYASSTYNKVFTFADKAVTDPEGLTSSCIVKYDKDGNEQWAISLVGACKIYAMTADADGTLYVAGKSEDVEINCTGTDGVSKKIVNPASDPWDIGVLSPTAHSCFVAKISKDGVFEAVKTISPEVNADIHAIIGDPWDTGDEINIYDNSFNDPMYVTPYAIKLDGDKVYVSASYVGDIPELSWKGAYLNAWGMMIYDLKSLGVFSLAKSDLTNAANVAYLQATGTVLYDTQIFPEAIDFVVQNGTAYVAFIGFGNLTLTTPAGEQSYEFKTTSDESGNKEHALVLVNCSEPAKSVIFNAANHDKEAIPYRLFSSLEGDACILAGTFYGQFPLDNAITVDENASFVASIDMKECSLNWRYVPNVHAEATCMIVTGEETHLATAEKKYTIKTADGTEKDIMDQGFADASSYNDQYCSTIFADEANVCLFCPKMNPSTGVKSLKDTKSADAKYFNASGMELSAPRKGLNIVKTAAGVKKVMK